MRLVQRTGHTAVPLFICLIHCIKISFHLLTCDVDGNLISADMYQLWQDLCTHVHQFAIGNYVNLMF